jgi:hypothetical protein
MLSRGISVQKGMFVTFAVLSQYISLHISTDSYLTVALCTIIHESKQKPVERH